MGLRAIPMKNVKMSKTTVLGALLVIILICSAYLGAGALHDFLVPEREEAPLVKVTFAQVQTNDLCFSVEHPHFTTSVFNGSDYDLGVWVDGLRSAKDVRIYFSLTCDGIAPQDVDVLFYHNASGSWRPLEFSDKGDSIVAVLGPSEGQDITEDLEQLFILLLFFYFDGDCVAKCWADAD